MESRSQSTLEILAQRHTEELEREQQKRRRLEATLLRALWRSEAHRRLAESNIIGVLVMDVTGQILDANEEFLRMLGRQRGAISLEGLRLQDITPAQYHEVDRRALTELALRGVATPWEKEHLNKEGQPVPVLLGAALLEGSHDRAIAFVLDLTERKRAEAKAAQYAQALRERNHQLEEDLRMARQIQQVFLPQQYPTVSFDLGNETLRLRFAHRYHPAGPVGGDFFDVIALPDSQAGIFICDVMGHGMRAALVTGMMRTLVEQLRPIGTDAGEMLTQINSGLIATLRQTGTPMFVSACYAVMDLKTRELQVANAGHPHPLLLCRKAGQVKELSCSRGPALGLLENRTYAREHHRIAPDEGLLLFTDGILDLEEPALEPPTPELLRRRVQDLVHLPAEQLMDSVISQMRGLAAHQGFVDDVCLLQMDVERHRRQ